MAIILPDLPYAYDALEPYIDEETMHLHHDKHHNTYVTNVNVALAKHPEIGEDLEKLLADVESIPADIRQAVINNGGGHLNHALFWELMTAEEGALFSLAQDGKIIVNNPHKADLALSSLNRSISI